MGIKQCNHVAIHVTAMCAVDPCGIPDVHTARCRVQHKESTSQCTAPGTANARTWQRTCGCMADIQSRHDRALCTRVHTAAFCRTSGCKADACSCGALRVAWLPSQIDLQYHDHPMIYWFSDIGSVINLQLHSLTSQCLLTCPQPP